MPQLIDLLCQFRTMGTDIYFKISKIVCKVRKLIADKLYVLQI